MQEQNLQPAHPSKKTNDGKPEAAVVYVFGNFRLDNKKEKLYKDDQELRIEKRMFLLLSLLIERSPEAIGKDELMSQLWKNQVVTDWSLSRLISDTRKILGDDGKSQKFIKTYRGEGFCFSGKVEVRNISGQTSSRGKTTKLFSSKQNRTKTLALLSAILFALTLVGINQYKNTQYTKKIELIQELEQYLILTKTSHEAQKKRRNELGKMLEARFDLDERKDWEHFFTEYYSKLNKNELFVHEQIRAITEGPVYKGNKNVLRILNDNPDLKNEFPSYQKLVNHLTFWLNKYEKVFTQRKDMCLLYTGEEDGVPFPSAIDQEVADWLSRKK